MIRALLVAAAALMVTLAGTAGARAAATAKPELFEYDSRGKRDPFAPLVRDGRMVGVSSGQRVEGGAKPVLYGVLWEDAPGASIALINDTEAKVGDIVAGYRIMEIRKDAVVLESEGGGEPLVLEIAFDTPPSKLSTGTPKGR
jgi:hypothetical protein